jgi:hypothetical protein
MKKIYLILFTTIITVSCTDTDALSPVNQTKIADNEAFNTPARVEQNVLGMYGGVKAGNFYGGRYFNYQDIRGEEFNNERTNSVTNLTTWNFGLGSSTSEVSNLWYAAYIAINRTNIVIDNLGASPVSEALKTQYKAEASFLRALSYFSIVTLYAKPYWVANGETLGVPLRLKGETVIGSSNLARATVAQVYDQILKDLDFAEANLPLTYSTAFNKTTRAHKNTAIALKTRVYLSMRKYDKVVLEANKIVSTSAPFTSTSGVTHSLAPNIASVFAASAVTAENVFSFAFSSNDLPGTQNALVYYYHPTIGNGEYSLISTGIVSNPSWKSTDARRALNVVSGGKTYVAKWIKPQSDPDHVAVIRYSEILLNLAEAIVRDGNVVTPRALELLNVVRQRSDATTTITASSVEDFLDKIAIERRIELLAEGFRSWDVMRLGQNFGAKSTVSSVRPTETQYIWPIPQKEILYNKLCDQNSGY